MPQTSAVYAVARVRFQEKRMFDKDALARMTGASKSEAIRQLLDAGYGDMPDATLEDVEIMIAKELKAAADLVKEITTKPELTDVFFLAADVNNLKLLIKLRLTGAKDTPVYAVGGLYDTAELKRMVETKEYKALPEKIALAAKKAEADIEQGDVNAAYISAEFDRGYISQALTNKDGFIQTYFKAMADFNNLIALTRLGAIGAGVEHFRKMLIDGGDIAQSALIKCYGQAADQLIKALPAGDMAGEMKKALEEYAQSGNPGAIERARDNALMRFASKGKNDTDSIAPVIGYLLGKQQEARCIRLVTTAVRNGLDGAVISERMRCAYGE